MQPVRWPMSLHVKSKQYKVYVFQNKYNFPYGGVSLSLRNYVSQVYLDFLYFHRPLEDRVTLGKGAICSEWTSQIRKTDLIYNWLKVL